MIESMVLMNISKIIWNGLSTNKKILIIYHCFLKLHFICKEIIVIFILSTTLGVILPKSMAGMQETVDCATVNVALLVLFYFLFRQYVDLGHEEAFVDSCTNTLI